MKTDNYTKFIHTIIALALLFLCADKVYNNVIQTVQAEPQVGEWECATVPWTGSASKEWYVEIENMLKKKGWKDFKMVFYNDLYEGFHSGSIQELVGRNYLVMDKSRYRNHNGVMVCGIKGK